MARNIPVRGRERPLRRDRGLRLPVALHAERLAHQVHEAVGLDHPRPARGGILLRRVLQHDLRRIRKRRTPDRHVRPGLLGRQLRPAALPARGIPQPLDYGVVRALRRPLRGRHRLQRHQRIFLLERIRRPLQLHRRRLSGLHQRGGGQHHGILSGRPDDARHRRRHAAYHVVPLPPRPRTGRIPQRMAVESRRRPGLRRGAVRGDRPAELQHPLSGQRKRLRQRTASQRALQVLRRLRQELPRLRTILHHASRSRGRSLRPRRLRQYGRQPACGKRRGGVGNPPQHRARHHREHERLVHGAFRQHGVDHAGPRLALPAGHGLRPRIRHGQPHGARTGGRDAVAPALPRAEHHQTPEQRRNVLHGSPAA